MANRPKGFGLTAELEEKRAEKYSLELEQEARKWIEAVLGNPLNLDVPSDEPLGPDRLHEALKDGTILCDLMNMLSPGSCKPSSSKMAFKQMENIGIFLNAVQEYDVRSQDCFQTVDLYEKTNMNAVVNTIHALGRKAQSKSYYVPFSSDSNN